MLTPSPENAVALDHVAEMDADAKFDARASGTPALRSAISSALDRAATASTTLRNSIRRPSPVA